MGYQLLYEHTGDEPRSIELALRYAKAIAKSPGRHGVSFEQPQSPVSRWRLTIPEPGVKVNVHPIVAVKEVPGPADGSAANETTVQAFVGAAAEVRIDWMPKAEGAVGLTALAGVETHQHVWVEEGVVRVRAALSYQISRAQLPGLSIEVPAEYKVTNVADANVRQWSVESDGPVSRVTIDLFEPAKDTQAVTVDLERFADDAGKRRIRVPQVRALGVVRQRGVVMITSGQGLRCEVVQGVGATQLDFEDLAGGASTGRDLAYRYTALPFSLVLGVEKIRPVVIADVLTEAHLLPQQLGLDVTAVFDVQRAGVFRFEFDLPSGYELDRVSGVDAQDAKPAAVDAYHVDEDGRLVVNLSRKAMGKVALGIGLSKRLSEPDLQTPTGREVELALSVPRVAASGVERQTSRLVIYAPEALDVTPKPVDGVGSAPIHEACQGIKAAGEGRSKGGSPVAAFVLEPGAPALPLTVQRRQPYTVARQLLITRLRPGVVTYQSRIHYDIRYSGVERLRIDVPVEYAGQIRNNTSGVRVETLAPQPDDVAQGYVAWGFTGQRQFLGSVAIQLDWERELGQLEVGKPVELSIPKLSPRGAQRAWGQVVIAKAQTIDVQPAGVLEGLRPIDPGHDLMPDAGVTDGARAFEFHGDDWSLTVSATHYQLEPVKRTSIEKALVRMVVTPSDQVTVQALYRVRSARQRLRVALPDGAAFDTAPLRVNGRVVALERGEQGRFLLPLAGLDEGKPFVVDLRYTVAGGTGRLGAPVFVDEPAVQKVYLSIYAPPQRVLLGSLGPWSQEMRWRLDAPSGMKPVANRDDAALVQWVIQGVDMPPNPGDSFQTDGQRYLYSSLRPLPPPDGALRLVTLDQTWLRVVVFLVISVGGLLAVKAGASARWLVVGGVFIAVILAGVFIPTFTLQVLDIVTLTAVCVVVVIWAVHYLVWERPRVVAQRVEEMRPWTATQLAAVTPGTAPGIAPGIAPGTIPGTNPGPIDAASETGADQDIGRSPKPKPNDRDEPGSKQGEAGDE